MNMLLKSRVAFVAWIYLLLATCPGIAQQAKPGSGADEARSTKANSATKAKITVADSTPEDALRTFMLALISQDEPAVRAVSVPSPDLAWLIKGDPAPPEVIKDVMAQLAKQPIKRLKEGENVPLPRGKQYVVAATDVGDDKAILLPQGAPLPTRLHKVKGHWKVVADPFIAGRKAADAARKKAEAKNAELKKPASKQ
jgi:hypothetical protein